MASIFEDDDEQVGSDLFLTPISKRSIEIAGEELAGGYATRNGERAGCEQDELSDYMRSDLRPVEE